MTLLFIYNANSGKLNALLDASHKLISPSTYPCRLCELTYDTFSENKIWKIYRKKSEVNMEFYHKDEFENEFPNESLTYPVVLSLDNNKLKTVLDSEALNEISDIEALIEILETIL